MAEQKTDAKPEEKKDEKAGKKDLKQEAKQEPKPEQKLLPGPSAPMPHPQTQELLAKSEISLWLDTYEDSWSDFDARPYWQRALSVDFLDEARRASREKKTGQAMLKFLAPAAIRSAQQEANIKKRLKEHFKKHSDTLRSEVEGQVRLGVLITILGFAMAAASAVIAYYFSSSLLAELIIVLLEPGGWFILWHGMDMAIFERREKEKDLDFYAKMANADITFESY